MQDPAILLFPLSDNPPKSAGVFNGEIISPLGEIRKGVNRILRQIIYNYNYEITKNYC